MSTAGRFKWRSLRGDADAENTWSFRTWVIVGGTAAAVIFFTVLIWALTNTAQEEKEKVVSTKSEPKRDMSWLAPTTTYKKNEAAAGMPAAPPPKAGVKYQRQTLQGQPAQEPIEVNDAIRNARTSGFGEYSPDDKGTFAAGTSGGAPCILNAGTSMMAEIDTFINTDNLSTVRAIVMHDVLGYDGCTGIPSGAVMVGKPEGVPARNAHNVNVVFNTAVINGTSVSLENVAAGTSMGGGGVPAQRNMHLASRLGAVAIATGVDLAGRSLSGGSKYGGVFVDNGGSVIDRMANEALDRPTTLTADPLKDRLVISIVLNQDLNL